MLDCQVSGYSVSSSHIRFLSVMLDCQVCGYSVSSSHIRFLSIMLDCQVPGYSVLSSRIRFLGLAKEAYEMVYFDDVSSISSVFVTRAEVHALLSNGHPRSTRCTTTVHWYQYPIECCLFGDSSFVTALKEDAASMVVFIFREMVLAL
eukprot:TRINITY_DN4087_c0_g1_i8.p1 TRINITY_DN4087_c0_g1~~TRINITY_DN4087_c0_g1_i8.p1  ORF type:complete len:148 (+),score=12.77 TRINITY_DN4087_c0_g1_i8:143-586(+)